MLSVIEPDGDAFWRHLCRWYSQKFHTPLHIVEELPSDHLLTHYFETIYEDMEPDDRHDAIIFMLESPEERKEREIREQEAEDDFMREAEAEVAEQNAKLKKDFKESVKNLSKTSLKDKVNKEKEYLDRVEELEEKIEIKFMEDDQFDELAEQDMIPTRRKS